MNMNAYQISVDDWETMTSEEKQEAHLAAIERLIMINQQIDYWHEQALDCLKQLDRE